MFAILRKIFPSTKVLFSLEKNFFLLKRNFPKGGSRLLLTILGSSLNAVVVFNLEVTHAARFALKTTTAFNEEPKK